MAKEKKITVKYYLNRKLKSKEINGEECFPVYMQLIYNRKNIRLKLKNENNTTVYLKKKIEFEDIEFMQLRNKFKYKEDRIKKIIRYEENRLSNFSLNSFSAKLEFYESKLFDPIRRILKIKVDSIAKEILSYNDYFVFQEKNLVTQISILEKSKKIPEEYLQDFLIYSLVYIKTRSILSREGMDKITIYDWILDDYKDKIESILRDQVDQYEIVKNQHKEMHNSFIRTVNKLKEKIDKTKSTIDEKNIVDKKIQSITNNHNDYIKHIQKRYDRPSIKKTIDAIDLLIKRGFKERGLK